MDLIFLGLFILVLGILVDLFWFGWLLQFTGRFGETLKVYLSVIAFFLAVDLVLRFFFGIPLLINRLIVGGVAGMILADRAVRRNT